MNTDSPSNREYLLNILFIFIVIIALFELIVLIYCNPYIKQLRKSSSETRIAHKTASESKMVTETKSMGYSQKQKLFVCCFMDDIGGRLETFKSSATGSTEEKMSTLRSIIDAGNEKIESSDCPNDFKEAWKNFSNTIFDALKIGIRMVTTGNITESEKQLLRDSEGYASKIYSIYEQCKE